MITQTPATAALHRVTSPFQAALPSLSSPQVAHSNRKLGTPHQLLFHWLQVTATWAGTQRGERRRNCFTAFTWYIITGTLSQGIFHHKACWNLILMCAILALELGNCFREVHFDVYVYPSIQYTALHHYIKKTYSIYFFQAYAHLAQVVLKHLAFIT